MNLVDGLRTAVREVGLQFTFFGVGTAALFIVLMIFVHPETDGGVQLGLVLCMLCVGAVQLVVLGLLKIFSVIKGRRDEGPTA